MRRFSFIGRVSILISVQVSFYRKIILVVVIFQPAVSMVRINTMWNNLRRTLVQFTSKRRNAML